MDTEKENSREVFFLPATHITKMAPWFVFGADEMQILFVIIINFITTINQSTKFIKS